MAGSLKTLGQGLNFEPEKLNLGIGSSFISNTRLSIINNNPSSWRTAIFKDTINSDFITIGNFNFNPHISAITDNGIFRDLYLNNLGIASQPSSLIGNIIINGKTTIGNSSNNTSFNHSLDVYTNSSNIAVFRNPNFNLSLTATPSNLTFNTNSKQVNFNSDVYISGFMIGSNYLSNISNNPSLYKLPANWIKTNPNSCITTNTNSEMELALDPNAGLIINSQKQLTFTGTITQVITTNNNSSVNFWNSNNNASTIYFKNAESYLGIGNSEPKSHLYVGQNANLLRLTSLNNINDNYFTQIGTTDTDNNNTKIRLISPSADVSLSSGSIFYTTCGNNNPIHSFNYELNGNRNELLKIEKNGLISISSNLIIGQYNSEANNYSLYVNSNAKFNNKVIIGNIISSFNGLPMITEYPLNVYGNIGITGNIFTTSDEKIKNNIKTLDNALDKIINCRGVSFNYINSDKKEIGVIAQEIEKIMPEIVENTNNGLKNVNYLAIIGYLIEAIKDLNNKINYIR
jgi:hypothetical protein